MQIGIEQIMQTWGYDDMTDGDIYDDELKLAVQADELGYDELWVVEHHFEDYSMCPDNFVYLAHLAALTKQIVLATGAVILPWNIQPLRVAEKAALLDHLSGGRFLSSASGAVCHGANTISSASPWKKLASASMRQPT